MFVCCWETAPRA